MRFGRQGCPRVLAVAAMAVLAPDSLTLETPTAHGLGAHH